MSTYNEEPTIFYTHLHKCGGTSVNAALENLFPKNKIFQIDGRRYEASTNDFISLPQQRKQEIKMVKGHMFFGLHEHTDGPSTYITMLREPLARLVSLYNYAFRTKHLNFYNRLINEKPNFVTFVQDNYGRTADNGMTRFIAGTNWNEVPYGHCNEDVLKKAIYNIDNHFVAVGLMEEFDKSLILFWNKLNLPAYPVCTCKKEVLNRYRAQQRNNRASLVNFQKLQQLYQKKMAAKKWFKNTIKDNIKKLLKV